MSNTIKFNATFDPSVTDLDIFKADKGLSVLDVANLNYVDTIPVSTDTYEDITGVEGESYRVAPSGTIDALSPDDITATFTYSISGA